MGNMCNCLRVFVCLWLSAWIFSLKDCQSEDDKCSSQSPVCTTIWPGFHCQISSSRRPQPLRKIQILLRLWIRFVLIHCYPRISANIDIEPSIIYGRPAGICSIFVCSISTYSRTIQFGDVAGSRITIYTQSLRANLHHSIENVDGLFGLCSHNLV